jgi:hypothetical protein
MRRQQGRKALERAGALDSYEVTECQQDRVWSAGLLERWRRLDEREFIKPGSTPDQVTDDYVVVTIVLGRMKACFESSHRPFSPATSVPPVAVRLSR